jgi:Gpi18-like mannosyltransferase
MDAPPQASFFRPRPAFALVVLAVLLRVVLILSGERHNDMDSFYRLWGVKANLYGLAAAYEPIRHYPGVQYPVLNPYLFLILDKGGNLLKRLFGDFDAFYYLFKSFLLFIDLCMAFLLYRIIAGQGRAPGRFFLGLFNPGLIVASVLWGQMDNLVTLFLLAVVADLAKARHWRAGAAFGLACATKLQAPLFLPLFLAFLAYQRSWKGILAFSGVAAGLYTVLALPFVLHGSAGLIVDMYLGTPDFHPFLSANAYNLWWLLSLGRGFRPDSLAVLPGVSAAAIGWTAFLAFYAMVLFALRKRPGDARALFAGASITAFAFFVLPTQMHERYFYPFLVFFLAVPGFDRRDLSFYGLVSLLFFMNMTMVFGQFRQYPFFACGPIWRWVSILVAAGYCTALVRAAAGFASVTRPRDPRLSSPGPG